MAKFVPANKLSSLISLISDLGRTHIWEQRSYTTSLRGGRSSLPSDGVIPEVASHQQSKAAGVRESKAFWMRDPATGDWIPEDHFGEIDVADLRAKLLPSRREQRSYTTSLRGGRSSLSSDGVIPEVASPQQSKAAGEKEDAKRESKGFWMRDPATGDWIPEDHFGEIDVADLRAKLLPSRK